MSIITVLALTFVTILFVVVLAACTSFANRSPADVELPDGDWTGAANLFPIDPVVTGAGARHNAQVTKRPLKMHSWI